jgi:hypothetical protein
MLTLMRDATGTRIDADVRRLAPMIDFGFHIYHTPMSLLRQCLSIPSATIGVYRRSLDQPLPLLGKTAGHPAGYASRAGITLAGTTPVSFWSRP